MILDEKKFANYHCDQYKSKLKGHEDAPGIETYSLAELKEQVEHMIDACSMNNIDPGNVPVFIVTDGTAGNEEYCFHGSGYGFGSLGMSCFLRTQIHGKYSERLYYVAPDSRPEEGEYWRSRGVGYDLSGFVVSKKAGERLLNMVKVVLGVNEPKSWLDYREHEPSWIQFKFQKEEFDLKKLDEMSRAADGALTMDILKACRVAIED